MRPSRVPLLFPRSSSNSSMCRDTIPSNIQHLTSMSFSKYLHKIKTMLFYLPHFILFSCDFLSSTNIRLPNSLKVLRFCSSSSTDPPHSSRSGRQPGAETPPFPSSSSIGQKKGPPNGNRHPGRPVLLWQDNPSHLYLLPRNLHLLFKCPGNRTSVCHHHHHIHHLTLVNQSAVSHHQP